jgi:hypothetical protein
MLGDAPPPRPETWTEDGDDTVTGMVAVPAFAQGGRVERTGIALVHQGEWIVPAEGSEALVSHGPGEATGAGPAVDFRFPVAVEIIGELDETHLQQIAEYLYDDLDSALRSSA